MNIKKVTACVCALSMIAAAVTQNTGGEFNIFDEQKVFAFVDESGIKYNELNDGTLEIVEYNGEDSVLVIPDEIDGKRVISIGDCAFSGCRGLTEITIPESVKSINFAAFDDVSSELKICGTEGSYAQKYAVNNDLKFEILSVTGDVDGNGIFSFSVHCFLPLAFQ